MRKTDIVAARLAFLVILCFTAVSATVKLFQGPVPSPSPQSLFFVWEPPLFSHPVAGSWNCPVLVADICSVPKHMLSMRCSLRGDALCINYICSQLDGLSEEMLSLYVTALYWAMWWIVTVLLQAHLSCHVCPHVQSLTASQVSVAEWWDWGHSTWGCQGVMNPAQIRTPAASTCGYCWKHFILLPDTAPGTCPGENASSYTQFLHGKILPCVPNYPNYPTEYRPLVCYCGL